VGGIFLNTQTIFPFGFFLFFQFIVPSYFWGKRRGEFEYSFLEKSAERGKPNKELHKLLNEVKRELKMSDVKSAHFEVVRIFGTGV
jgi:hypothetical protein